MKHSYASAVVNLSAAISPNISYPFWGGDRPDFCGFLPLKLECRDNQYPVMNISDLEYRVLGINQTRRAMILARSDLWDDNTDLCRRVGGITKNTSLKHDVFQSPQFVRNLTISYGCPVKTLSPVPKALRSSMNNFMCNDRQNVYYFADDFVLSYLGPHLTSCSGTVQVPIFLAALHKSHNYES